MELRHLRYFTVVAEEEHFGRAAKRLHIAQPALSRCVADLEAELGIELFERLPRGVRLSMAGQVFLEDAQDLLKRAQQVAERAQRAARGEVGNLTIGFTESASWHGELPKSYATFHQQMPAVRLRLLPMNSFEQLAAIRERQLDAGFLYYRPPDEPTLAAEIVSTADVVLAVHVKHRFASQTELRLRDLINEPFVFFPRSANPIHFDRVVRACLASGLVMNVVQEANNDSTVLSLVAAGIGVAWMPTTTVWRKPENVRLVPVRDLSVPLVLEFVWRADDCSPVLNAFLKIMQTVKGIS